MKTIRMFGYDQEGSSRVWWNWQDLRDKAKRKGLLCTHGRAWLYFPGNCFGVEWSLFGRRCAIELEFSTTGDEHILFSLSIPFVFALYLSLERASWITRLPGVKWDGNFRNGDREIGLRIFGGAIWWRLWRNPMIGEGRDWRDGCFHVDDFLLGRPQYSQSAHERHTANLLMPEGVYPVKVELYTATWKRKRWPWPKTVKRANVTIESGLAVPGDGENDWDMDDDAIYESTFPAASVGEALELVRESALRQRGGDTWSPAEGW